MAAYLNHLAKRALCFCESASCPSLSLINIKTHKHLGNQLRTKIPYTTDKQKKYGKKGYLIIYFQNSYL